MSAFGEIARLKYKHLTRPPGVEKTDEEIEEDEEEDEEFRRDLAKDLTKGKGVEVLESTLDIKLKEPKKGEENWPWKISEDGGRLLDEMIRAARDTRPDDHGVYLRKHFHGYGCMEVIENRILRFARAMNRKEISLLELWLNIEALAYFFISGFDYWLRSDDSERGDRILNICAAMYFAFLSKLPNGASDLKQIKNAPAIFGAIFEFTTDVLNIAESYYRDILTWVPTLLAILEEAEVEIWDGHESLEKVKEKVGPVIEGADKLQAAKQKWLFGSLLSQTREKYAFGGSAHDLTRWSKAEKENGRLGPVRAKRLAIGSIYSDSEDEENDYDKRTAKPGKTAPKKGAKRKRVRSYY